MKLRRSISIEDDTLKEAGTDDTGKRTMGNLIIDEERNIGAVPLSMYGKYLKTSGGYLCFIYVLMGYIIAGANSMFSSAWITLWTRDGYDEIQSQSIYEVIYAFLAITITILTYLQTMLLVRFGI